MKQKIQAKDIELFVAQMLLLSLIMLSPALISFISSNGDSNLALDSLWIAFYWLAPAMAVYLLNFYLFIPSLRSTVTPGKLPTCWFEPVS